MGTAPERLRARCSATARRDKQVRYRDGKEQFPSYPLFSPPPTASCDPTCDLLNAIHPHCECWRIDLRHALATDLVGETRQRLERGLKRRRSAEISGKI